MRKQEGNEPNGRSSFIILIDRFNTNAWSPSRRSGSVLECDYKHLLDLAMKGDRRLFVSHPGRARSTAARSTGFGDSNRWGGGLPLTDEGHNRFYLGRAQAITPRWHRSVRNTHRNNMDCRGIIGHFLKERLNIDRWTSSCSLSF